MNDPQVTNQSNSFPSPEIKTFRFNYAVTIWVDDEGDVMARVSNLPKNVSLMAHGADATEALEHLTGIIELYEAELNLPSQPQERSNA